MSNPTPLSDEIDSFNRMLDAYDEEECAIKEEAERVSNVYNEVDSNGSLPQKLGDGLKRTMILLDKSGATGRCRRCNAKKPLGFRCCGKYVQ